MRGLYPYVLLIVAVLTAGVGCVSVDCSGPAALEGLAIDRMPGRPVEHVVVSNFGYYLFNLFPIVAGNARPGACFPCSFFSNQVTLPKVHALMAEEVARRPGVEVAELGAHFESSPCFSVSTDPRSALGLIFCYREVQLSAVLVESAKGKEAAP